jgi:hypothetical protein
MPLMSAFQDKFTGASLNRDKWTFDQVSGTGVLSDGKYTITLTPSTAGSYGQLLAGQNFVTQKYDLTSNYAHVKVLQVSAGTNPTTILKLAIDGSNFLTMQHLNGNLMAIKCVTGTPTTLASVTYNATTMLWWRIRETGGTTFWEYSADTYTWTTLFSVANPIVVTSLQPQLQCLENSSDAAATAAIFASFNALPSGIFTNAMRPRAFAPGLAR